MTDKKPQGKKRKVKRHHLENSTILMIAGVFVVLTLFVWKAGQPVDYTDMTTAKSSDSKFQIDVPKEMEPLQSGINIINYQHTQSDESKGLISHVRVESQFIGEADLRQTQQAVWAQLKNRNGAYFVSFKQKAQGSPSAKDLYFSDFTYYDGPNIKDGLSADFSYGYDSVEVSGRMVVAFSRDAIYVVTIEATKDVWHNNQPIWDKMLTSFRFD